MTNENTQETEGKAEVYLPRLVRPLRTDEEIVTQTDRLARVMALCSGYVFDADYKFHRHSRLADNPMPRQFKSWELARQAQILLTDTDPDDAVDNLDWASEKLCGGGPEGGSNAR